jgi:hypothetical protein
LLILLVIYLAQAEELLKKQNVIGSGSNTDLSTEIGAPASSDLSQNFGLEVPIPAPDEFPFSSSHAEVQMMTSSPPEVFPHSAQDTETNPFQTDDFSWAIVDLGVQEPLPPQETIDELYLSYPFFIETQ